MRADFFVVNTNIHWPSDSSLIRDGIRKILELCVDIDSVLKHGGWRQSRHLLKIAQVRAEQQRIIGERDAGDFQILRANPHAGSAKSFEVIRGRLVPIDNRPSTIGNYPRIPARNALT